MPRAAPAAAVASTPSQGDAASSSASCAFPPDAAACARVFDSSSGFSTARVVAVQMAPASARRRSWPPRSSTGRRTGVMSDRMDRLAPSMRPNAAAGNLCVAPSQTGTRPTPRSAVSDDDAASRGAQRAAVGGGTLRRAAYSSRAVAVAGLITRTPSTSEKTAPRDWARV